MRKTTPAVVLALLVGLHAGCIFHRTYAKPARLFASGGKPDTPIQGVQLKDGRKISFPEDRPAFVVDGFVTGYSSSSATTGIFRAESEVSAAVMDTSGRVLSLRDKSGASYEVGPPPKVQSIRKVAGGYELVLFSSTPVRIPVGECESMLVREASSDTSFLAIVGVLGPLFFLYWLSGRM